MRYSYIQIGTGVNSNNTLKNALELPAPIELPSSNEFMAEAERNANGSMMIQQVGRTQYTTQFKWNSLPNKKWWQINRWFDTYGYVFYMKYFNHADGRVKIHRFYRGNIEKGIPSTVVEEINGLIVPKFYKGCGFNVIDMGENNVKIITELTI